LLRSVEIMRTNADMSLVCVQTLTLAFIYLFRAYYEVLYVELTMPSIFEPTKSTLHKQTPWRWILPRKGVVHKMQRIQHTQFSRFDWHC